MKKALILTAITATIALQMWIAGQAQEKIGLSTPAAIDPRQTTEVEVGYVTIHKVDGFIEIGLWDAANEVWLKRVRYTDTIDENGDLVPTFTNIVRSFNRADFRTKSLERTALEKLISDGHVKGVVEGTPRR